MLSGTESQCICFLLLEIDWVVSQTIERKRRVIEAEERDYEERLLKARQKEAVLRNMARAKARKRVVEYF